MSIISEISADRLKVKIFDSKEAMDQGAAQEVSVKIKELLSKKQ